MFNTLEITGRACTHVVQIEAPHRFAAHPEAAAAFLAMREDAAKAGFDILPYSAFRDYATQLRIWNRKFRGDKPLYDRNGQPRDFAALSEDEIIGHILDWSALPGASRHHWGTEIDVVDAAAMAEGYVPKLLPEEVTDGGIFQELHAWLDAHAGHYGFFRPYASFRGGMFPEPWHLSYAPLAGAALGALTLDLLIEVTRQADILGKVRLLQRMPQIYASHVMNVAAPAGMTA